MAECWSPKPETRVRFFLPLPSFVEQCLARESNFFGITSSMKIIENILRTLQVTFLNRNQSSSFKTDSSIRAGGDIIGNIYNHTNNIVTKEEGGQGPFLVLYIRDITEYPLEKQRKLTDEGYPLTYEIEEKVDRDIQKAIVNSNYLFRVRNQGDDVALNVSLESKNFIGYKYQSNQIVAGGDEQSVKIVKKPSDKIRSLMDLNNEIFIITCTSRHGDKFISKWKVVDIFNKSVKHIYDQASTTDLEDKRVGLILRGKGAVLIDNEIGGPDAGMIDFGVDTKMKRNKIFTTDKQVGNKSGKDIPLILKYFLAAVAILGFMWGVYIYFNPNLQKVDISTSTSSTISIPDLLSTTTPNISSILSRNLEFKTAYEREKFLENYKGKRIVGRGVYLDFFNSQDHYFVQINLSSEKVVCDLQDNNEAVNLIGDLLLLQEGQEFTFSGIFANDFLNGDYRIIYNCEWLR